MDASADRELHRELLEGLAAAVGEAGVVTDPDVRAGAERDWTGRFGGPSLAVVRPSSTGEVAEVLRCCAAHGVAVVPQGGNTGLVGGSVPQPSRPRCVVLSTVRLQRMDPVDQAAAQVTVGAGVTLAALQRHAATSGLEYAVDLASRDTATIGGTVATNAGGAQAFARGSTRAQVLGVEAVLADGSVVSRLSGLVKDNTGYDLAGLLTGSEGTLAVITAARLALQPRPTHVTTALVAVGGPAEALALLAGARAGVPGLRAVELMAPKAVQLVVGTGLPEPPGRGWLLLLEAAGGADHVDLLAAVVGDLPGAVATETLDRQRLWAYRELVPEAIARAGVPHKLDVAVPVPAVPEFVAAVEHELSAYDVVVFGHLADGNLHVNVLGAGDTLGDEGDAVDDLVLGLALGHGGTISAEHGIGVAKVRWLERARGAADVAAMRAVKDALDPGGLLNPGVIFG